MSTSQSLRTQVLRCYRALHRTRKKIFVDDRYALQAAAAKIREEFTKNKDVVDPAKIEELLKIGWDAELILRKTVVQARRNERGNYEIRFTKDTALQDNALPKF